MTNKKEQNNSSLKENFSQKKLCPQHFRRKNYFLFENKQLLFYSKIFLMLPLF